MKRIITVKEFVDSYLYPLQDIRIEDLESDYVYFEGTAKIIQDSYGEVYSARLLKIDVHHNLNKKDCLVLYI